MNFRGGFATDYIYRGTALLDHTPAVGAAIEAAFAQLYAGVGVASVKLPTQPSTEITMSGGIGQTIGNVDFDLGATYFLYPGEIVAAGSNGLTIGKQLSAPIKRISDSIRIAGGFAYSPNVSNTGTQLRGWGSSCPVTCFRPTWVCLSQAPLVIPGLATSRRTSAAFRFVPI
ncbi:MAG TPA: TorF family putative porin [Pseudolabrys sp.]